jgi:radical SAM protein with 4Fe4S-binding SPASM domain
MTDRCNLKCQGCYRSTIGVKKSNEITVSTVQKLLSLYPSLDAFCVAGLGEPTLCSNFVSIVNFLKKNMKFVGIITNGTNLDKILELAYAPNYISISLKGYNKESYSAHTGVDAFHKVLRNFKRLQARFKNVGFSYLLNRLNYEDLEKVLLLCDELKPDFLHLTNYLVYDPAAQEEIEKIITVKDSEIINYINRTCANRDYIKIKPTYVDFDNAKFNCLSYDYVINIDGDGNISACERQIPPEASFGNIFTDKDPYNSLKMHKFRKHIRNKSYPHEECRFCFANWQT